MKTFGKTLLALSLTAAVAGAAQADSKVLQMCIRDRGYSHSFILALVRR